MLAVDCYLCPSCTIRFALRPVVGCGLERCPASPSTAQAHTPTCPRCTRGHWVTVRPQTKCGMISQRISEVAATPLGENRERPFTHVHTGGARDNDRNQVHLIRFVTDLCVSRSRSLWCRGRIRTPEKHLSVCVSVESINGCCPDRPRLIGVFFAEIIPRPPGGHRECSMNLPCPPSGPYVHISGPFQGKDHDHGEFKRHSIDRIAHVCVLLALIGHGSFWCTRPALIGPVAANGIHSPFLLASGEASPGITIAATEEPTGVRERRLSGVSDWTRTQSPAAVVLAVDPREGQTGSSDVLEFAKHRSAAGGC